MKTRRSTFQPRKAVYVEAKGKGGNELGRKEEAWLGLRQQHDMRLERQVRTTPCWGI